MRTPIFLEWITRSHEIFDIFNSRLDKLILVDKEQAKQLTMKAVLRALFSVSLFALLLIGANSANAQTNNPPALGPDAQQGTVTGTSQIPSNASIKDAGTQQNNNQQSSNQQPVQMDQNVESHLQQLLTDSKNQLQQLGPNDPMRARLEDKIEHLENQLNNQ